MSEYIDQSALFDHLMDALLALDRAMEVVEPGDGESVVSMSPWRLALCARLGRAIREVEQIDLLAKSADLR